MKRIFISAAIIIFALLSNANAQEYKTGIGLRAGFSTGATIKHFIRPTRALEGIIGFRWGGVNITGLYEVHKSKAFDVNRLNWYYGGGGHLGFWNGEYNPWFKENKSYTVIGIDGIIGLEYNFSEAPLNISIDWKPGLNLIGYSGFWGDEVGLSVRYIF